MGAIMGAQVPRCKASRIYFDVFPDGVVTMNTSLLLWSLLFSSVGIGYFIYGRKQGNKIVLYSGLGLMVSPYFVDTLLAMILIGVGLILLPRFLKI
jgi:hypothetical protein